MVSVEAKLVRIYEREEATLRLNPPDDQHTFFHSAHLVHVREDEQGLLVESWRAFWVDTGNKSSGSKSKPTKPYAGTEGVI